MTTPETPGAQGPARPGGAADPVGVGFGASDPAGAGRRAAPRAVDGGGPDAVDAGGGAAAWRGGEPASAPRLDGVDVRWAPPPPPPPPRVAGWSLTLAALGLVASLFVGWVFPLGVVAGVMAIIALRRLWERRGVALWALALALLSLVYSAGWLWWAIPQMRF